MSELDVVFANLCFAAIAAGDMDPSRAPSAWRPLLRARRNCAIAGMNAHINRDLPQGVVQVFEALGGDPTSDEARRQDFDSVNELLERVEGEVKTDFSVGVIGVVDVAAGRVDDIAAMWKVRVAPKSRVDERQSAVNAPACAAHSQRVLRHTRQIHRTSWARTPHPNGDRHSPYVVPMF